MRSSRKVQKLEREELFNYGVKLLSLRANSTGELRGKLQRKALKTEDVDAAIHRLKEIGYLNDERFAEGFATARRDNEGFGKFRVLTDLRRRQIPARVADAVVAEAYQATSEEAMVTEFIERRMRLISAGGVDDQKQLAAAYRRLRRAGFSTGPVMTVLKRFAARPEELSEPEEDTEPE